MFGNSYLNTKAFNFFSRLQKTGICEALKPTSFEISVLVYVIWTSLLKL